MHSRKRLAKVIDQILTSEEEKLAEVEAVDASTVNSYQKLNEECDATLTKIKGRKKKKTIQQAGE